MAEDKAPKNLTPKLYSVPDLLKEADSTQQWIIKDLLKMGDQMLLSAAPKTGKSLLAAEIAIELARPFAENEERFLFAPKTTGQKPAKTLLQIYPPKDAAKRSWRVLFFSLEMREGLVGDRLRTQLKDYFNFTNDALSKGKVDPSSWNLDLIHAFGIPAKSKTREYTRQGIEILKESTAPGAHGKVEEGTDAEIIHELIKEQKPDVVVFDTLIQLHSVSENDNVAMKQLLQKIRDITCRDAANPHVMEPVAHIIVHHTRKENASQREPLSPEMMRGAGSVHGAADVVLLSRLHHRDNDGTRILEMHVSSRSSDIENFFLKRTKHLTHGWHELTVIEKVGKNAQKNICFQKAIKSLLKNTGNVGAIINHARILEEVAAVHKAENATFKIPDGVNTVSTQVDYLITTGQIEFAEDVQGLEASDWKSRKLRIKMDEPKIPATAEPQSTPTKPRRKSKPKKKQKSKRRKKISHSR